MEIEILKVWYQESGYRIVVTVLYKQQQRSGAWNRIEVSIFLDWIDSYAEFKRQALEKAKAFLLHAASAH
jgi:hypothetical protein